MQRRPIQGVASAALVALGLGTAALGAAAADPADLSLTKSDSPDPVTEGALLTYTVVVRNLGPDTATAATVEDDLPAAIEFVDASASPGTCERQGGRVRCQLGDLVAGAEATVTIRVRPKKREGELANTATIESGVPDPQSQNNSDTEVTRIAAPSAPTCAGRPATIVGTPGDDRDGGALLGDGEGNVIKALAGDDAVRARGGNDTVCLNRGNDRGRGGSGHDLLKGGADSDRIKGGIGRDALRGGAGDDVLRGGPGRDVLRGGSGEDVCRGGPGRDVKRSC